MTHIWSLCIKHCIKLPHCTPLKKDKHHKPIKKKPKVFKLTKETKTKSKQTQTDLSGVVWVHCRTGRQLNRFLGIAVVGQKTITSKGIRLTGQTRYQEARAQLEKHWGKCRPVIQLLGRMRSLVSRKSGDVAPACSLEDWRNSDSGPCFLLLYN